MLKQLPYETYLIQPVDGSQISTVFLHTVCSHYPILHFKYKSLTHRDEDKDSQAYIDQHTETLWI